jgi:hypothetical protein
MVPAKGGIFGIRGNAESTTYGRQTAASGTNPTLTARILPLIPGIKGGNMPFEANQSKIFTQIRIRARRCQAGLRDHSF